jgi:uncharacterized protein YbbK (DUF523 family)
VPLPTIDEIMALPDPSVAAPIKILLSGCLAWQKCGYEGTSYGEWPHWPRLRDSRVVRVVPFCPEDFSFGTPRELCDIHGGNGFDVLDGKAVVLSASGKDWTDGMVKAAHRMLAVAQEHQVDFAILMDMSAACGSQVISHGDRLVKDRKYQVGPGVCAALLLRNGYRVLSQRDHKTLGWLLRKIDPAHELDPNALDHHEGAWYRAYFGATR